MKTMRLLPALVLFVFVSSCGGPKGDLTRSSLKGHVKSVAEHQYDATAKDGKWVAGRPTINGHRITEYDEDGYYLVSVSLNHMGDTLGSTKVIRNGEGDMIEEVYTSPYERNATRTKLDRVSPDQVNFELWEGDRMLFEGANYFDSKGRMMQQVRVVNNVELAIHWVYEDDLLMENFQEEVETGKRTYTQLYEYTTFDDHGNWTERLVYPGADRIKAELVIRREITYY
ncbi:MAG: hypothetical protein R2751_01490 [Bacteroidales bacterium]